MMKIAVLTGSPYHPETSGQLADASVRGVTETGNEAYRFDAECQTGEFSMIKLEDDHPGQEAAIEPNDIAANEVMFKLLATDTIILVSSLYYYGINTALKAVIDRLYSYNHELHSGKKATTLVSGYNQADAFVSPNSYFKQLLEYMC